MARTQADDERKRPGPLAADGQQAGSDAGDLASPGLLTGADAQRQAPAGPARGRKRTQAAEGAPAQPDRRERKLAKARARDDSKRLGDPTGSDPGTDAAGVDRSVAAAFPAGPPPRPAPADPPRLVPPSGPPEALSAVRRLSTAGPAGSVATEPSRAASDPAVASGQPRSSRRKSRRKSHRWQLVAAGVGVVAVGAVAVELVPAGAAGPVHVITTPERVGNYIQAPALAASMKAAQLRDSIMSQSSGEARHVVAAVYEDSAGPAASAGPQIVLFIGGNLSGSSASSFISSFIGRLPGAVTTAAGSLGGAAACVPSVSGNPAECAWADGDTFGLVASPTLGARALAGELRQLRPQVEHLAR